VAFNELHGELPSNLGDRLPNLSYLFIGKNHLTGSLPASLVNATQGPFVWAPPSSSNSFQAVEAGVQTTSIFWASSKQSMGWSAPRICTTMRKLRFRCFSQPRLAPNSLLQEYPPTKSHNTHQMPLNGSFLFVLRLPCSPATNTTIFSVRVRTQPPPTSGPPPLDLRRPVAPPSSSRRNEIPRP
jgi:hypothetical protein